MAHIINQGTVVNPEVYLGAKTRRARQRMGEHGANWLQIEENAQRAIERAFKE